MNGCLEVTFVTGIVGVWLVLLLASLLFRPAEARSGQRLREMMLTVWSVILLLTWIMALLKST